MVTTLHCVRDSSNDAADRLYETLLETVIVSSQKFFQEIIHCILFIIYIICD